MTTCTCPNCDSELTASDFGDRIFTRPNGRGNSMWGKCPACEAELRLVEAGNGWDLDDCRVEVEQPRD